MRISMYPGGRGAALLYWSAALVLILGVGMAFSRFPGGYDWAYTVVSKLGSSRQNPAGARWVSGSLLLTMLLLWPVANHLAGKCETSRLWPRFAIMALRVGLIGGVLLGLEGLLALELSRRVGKAHEALALITFLGFYGGVLGLYRHRIRETASALVPALLVVLPLVAVGITQLLLYVSQRDLGWVNTGWRELGVPLWLSFAFWQWLAVAFLGVGLGCLVLSGGDSGPAPAAE